MTIQETVESTVKDLVYKVAFEKVKSVLISKIPFLGFKLINPLFGFLLGKLFDVVYAEIKTAVEFGFIDMEVAAQKIAYEQAVTNLKTELSKPGVQLNDQAIQNAKAELEKRLADLIHFKS